MSRPSETSRARITILLGTVSALLFTPGASAAALTFDPGGDYTNGISDASGATWNTTNTNWFVDSSTPDVAWPNTTADTAIFGSGTSNGTGSIFTAAVAGTVNANAIIFNTANNTGSTNQSYTLTGSGATIALGGTTPTITVNASTARIEPKVVTASLIKAGTGTLILAPANGSSFGVVSVNAGLLDTYNTFTATDVTVAAAGKFDTHSGTTWNLSSLTYNGTTTSSLNAFTSTSTYNIGSGGLTINAGTINVTAGSAAASAASAIVNLNGPLTLNGGNLALSSAVGTTGVARVILGGDVTSTGGTISSSGPTTGSSTELFDLGGATRTFTVNNLVETDPKTLNLNAITGNGSLTKAGTGILVIGGAEANLYTGLTTVSAGVLKLGKTAGVNSIIGDIAVNGGILEWATSNQVSDTSNITVAGGAVRFGAATISETIGSLTQTSGTMNENGGTNNGFLTVTGAVVATGGTGLSLNSGAQWNVGSLALSGLSGNNLALNGNSSRLTLMTVGAGGLTMTGQTYALNKATTAGNAGSELALNGNLTASGTNNVSATGGANGVSQVNLGAGIRTFNVTSGTTTVNSDIVSLTDGAGTTVPTRTSVLGGLTKTGAGVLALNGNNTYTGPTVISAGTLRVGSSGLLDVTPIVTVAPSATFDVAAVTGGYSLKIGQTVAGGGTVSGAFMANSGAVVAPGTTGGDTTQTLTFNAGLTLATGSTVNLEFGVGDNDKLSITGSLVQADGAKIVLGPISGALTLGQTFDFADFTMGFTASTNLGATIRDGSADSAFDLDLPDISSTGYAWSIANFATAGTIEVVPEPGSALLILSGLGALGLRRRRK